MTGIPSRSTLPNTAGNNPRSAPALPVTDVTRSWVPSVPVALNRAASATKEAAAGPRTTRTASAKGAVDFASTPAGMRPMMAAQELV